ncbi:hypothetical protein TNCV_2599621 [Trichonephila clavipes]|nr:hypothetical protein TNCV_2599621 [Trichonephila clavipes]
MFRCMFREDTGAPGEGATYAWMVADEAVGGARAFLTMWRSSRRLNSAACDLSHSVTRTRSSLSSSKRCVVSQFFILGNK